MQWVLLISLIFTVSAQPQAEFSVTTTSEGIQIVLHNLPGIYTGPTLSFGDFPFQDLQAITAQLLDLEPEQVIDVAQVYSNGELSQSVTVYPLTEEEADHVFTLIQIWTDDRTLLAEAYREVMEGTYLKAYPCVDGTWSNTALVPCLFCWGCAEPSVVSEQCTLTSDSVCSAACADGTWSSTGFEPCALHSTCDGLIETSGSSTSDVECVDTCVPGITFSDDGLPPCQACTQCENGLGSDCLINQNAVCTDECAPGFWSCTGRGPCEACTVCNPPTDPYRRECTQYKDAECHSQCEAGVTWSETGTAPCQPCDTCEDWEDCFAVCIPTRNTQCSPKPCVDGKGWSETGYELCNACSECDGKVCAHCVADRDTVCEDSHDPCVAGKTWSPSGYSPCTPCTEELECGPRGCYSSCIPTRDTICNDECIEQVSWSPTGREPCQPCTTEEECGFHGRYSSCIPTRDTVCYPDCEDGVSFSWTGQAPCAQCREVCPELEKVREACTTDHDLICSGDLCTAGTCDSDSFCDLRYGEEGVCIPCAARPSCLDWTLDLTGFAACKDVCEPTPTAKPTTTTTEPPTPIAPVPCPDGGWSKDGYKPCNECTDCGAIGEANACTSNSDTVCNVACEEGTWSESGVQPCMACSTCVEGFYLSQCSSTADAVCNPDECADLTTDSGSKWHDPLGEDYDCSWYADRTHCDDFGATSYNFGMNANEACCACGGGQTRPPTMGSTDPPTPEPTDHFMYQVCECATAYSGLCSSTAESLALVDDEACSGLDQTTVAELLDGKTFGEYCPNCPQGQCVDVVPVGVEKWTDASPDNCDCDWYDASDKNCALYGNMYEKYGYTAVQACCSCGGGITNTPTMAPHTPTPTHHPTEPVIANEDCAVVRISDATVTELNGDYSVITWDANAGRPAWSKSGGNNNVDIIHPVYGKTNYWQLGLNGFVGDIYYATVAGADSLYPVPYETLSGTLSWTIAGGSDAVESTVTCLSETTTSTEVVTDAPEETTTTTTTEAPTCDDQIDNAVQQNTFELLQQVSAAEEATESCNTALTTTQTERDACLNGEDLAACNEDVAACGTDLASCNSDNGVLNTDLQSCSTNLQQASTGLTDCSASLTQSSADLTACADSLGTCSGSLDTCNSDLAAARAEIDSCSSDIAVCNEYANGLQSSLEASQAALDSCCNNDDGPESGSTFTSLTTTSCLDGVSGFVLDGLDDDVCVVQGENGQQEIAIVVGDIVYPTCVAYSESMEGACPTDTHYCSGSGNTYGYRGNVISSVNEARTRANYKHPGCPSYAGVCDLFSNYWTGTIFPNAGVSESDVANLCVSSSGLVNLVTSTGLVGTCVGFSETAQDLCTMANYICAGVASGNLVYGWPGQIGAMVRVALDEESNAHPQCPF